MKPNTSNKNEDIGLKIQMYLISLQLLFVLLIPITLQVEKPTIDLCSFFKNLIIKNIFPLACLFMVIVDIFLIRLLKYRLNGTKNLPITIKKVDNESFEYLTFLTTYIIPLVCIDLKSIRYIFVLLVLLIIIGMIFIKNDFYLGNPTLALMNYRLYRIKLNEGNEETEKVVITKDILKDGDSIQSIYFDKNNWYVRKA